MELDPKTIAKEVAQELRRTQSLVVTAADIAAMCGYAANSHAIRQMLADPSFPPSVSLVEGGNRRYLRADVERWIQDRFRQQGREIMAAMRA